MPFTEEFKKKTPPPPTENPTGGGVSEIANEINNNYAVYGSWGLIIALATITTRYIYRKCKKPKQLY